MSLGDQSISTMRNSSGQQPTKEKPWNNKQQQTNSDASESGVTQPLNYIFPPLEHCVLTHYILPRRCYLPALPHTMTALSCPFFLLKIRYQNSLKGGTKKHTLVLIFTVFVGH